MTIYTDFNCVNVQTKTRNAITYHKNICFLFSSSSLKKLILLLSDEAGTFNIKYVFRPSY